MNFDVGCLVQREFPDALCPFCSALICFQDLLGDDGMMSSCPSCLNQWGTIGSVESFFRSHKGSWLDLNSADGLLHARRLMECVSAYRDGDLLPLQLLFNLLSSSKYFFHFATGKFTTELLGALALLSTRVPVRGVIGDQLDQAVDIYKTQTLQSFKALKNLEVYLTGGERPLQATHQKIYVFDGIIAVTGSLNLTLNGWDKAKESRELLEVVTDLERIRKLNNRYISRFLPRRELDMLDGCGVTN